MDRDQLGLKQGVDLAAVESCHVKSSPQGVVLHQGQLDVPCIKKCILSGQNVLGKYACDFLIVEHSLFGVYPSNSPHHL